MTEAKPVPGVNLGRRLAVGGMGELFLAERATPHGVERCVLKRLLPGAGEAERLFFAREIEALGAVARAGGEGVVRRLDAGPDWILLEHVDGCDLDALLTARRKRGRPLPLGVVAHLARSIALGLASVERAGLVHRDVHPGNVLLGRDGTIKLADLGVVAFTEGRGPTVAGLKGTLAYMAPEQLREGRADARSDLYAAGLVLWEALTGAPARPMGAVGLVELLAARERAPAPPSALRAEAAPFDGVVMHALAPDPAARPPSVAAWAAALDAALATAGVAPDPAGLAALVEPMAERAPVATSRTIAPRGELVAAPSSPPARRARWPWIVGPAIVGVGLVAWLALDGPASAPREEAAARAVGPWAPSPAAPSIEAPDAGTPAADLLVAPSTIVDIVESAEVAPAPDTRIEAVVTDAAPDARARDAREREVEAREVQASAARAIRVRVRATRGDVHVRGGGVGGLAGAHPGWVLAAGESVVATLTGGAPPFGVQLRAIHHAEGGVSVNLGASAGASVEATCGSRVGPLPMSRLALPLSCRLQATDGATMAIAVVGDVE